MPQPPAASATETVPRLMPTAKMTAKNFVMFQSPRIKRSTQRDFACAFGQFNLDSVKNATAL
jgi:hypothetical protein